MPNDTIDRGIKKAAGDGDGVNYEEVTYEGYGPNGIAIIVKALTDNKTELQATCATLLQKEAEVSEHRDVCHICLMKKVRLLFQKKNLRIMI